MYKLHAKNKKRGRRSFQHEEEQRNERINDERKKERNENSHLMVITIIRNSVNVKTR